MTETINANTVALRFEGVVTTGTAGGALKPGQLVIENGSSAIVVHPVVGGPAAPAKVVQEKSDVGIGTIAPNWGRSADYANGDQVTLLIPYSGSRMRMFLKAGQNVSKNDLLVSAGDGTLQKATTTSAAAQTVIGRAGEAKNLSASGAVNTLISVEIA